MDDTAGQETNKLQFQKVMYHRVNTKQEEDVLIYEDKNQPDYMFSVEVSNCGGYLILDTRKDCDDLGLISYAKTEGLEFNS